MGLGQVGMAGGFRRTVDYRVFGADSAFRLGWRTTVVVQFSAFQWFFAGVGGVLVLAGVLCAGVSFYGVWALS